MPDNIRELLDTAINREIVSQAAYNSGLGMTEDPGMKALLKDLAQDEMRHSEMLRSIKENGWLEQGWHRDMVEDLKQHGYLVDTETLQSAGLEETLIYILKREQQSIEFYTRLMETMRSFFAKRLCERLAHDEIRHKLRLDIFYDNLFYGTEEVKQ